MWRQEDRESLDGETELLHICAENHGPFKHPSEKGGQGAAEGSGQPRDSPSLGMVRMGI